MGEPQAGPVTPAPEPREGERIPAALWRCVVLGVLQLLVAEALAVAGVVPPPHRALLQVFREDWAFFTFALAGAALIHVLCRPSRRELAVAGGVGLAFFGVLWLVRPAVGRHPFIALVHVAGCLGVGSLVALSVSPGRRTVLGLAGCLPMYIVAIDSYLWLTSVWHPRTPDLLALAFDASFGAQASFAMGRLFASHRWLAVTSMLVYQALPLAAAVVLGSLARRDADRASAVGWSIVVAGALGFGLYHLFPLAGPKATFAGFPDAVPQVGPGILPWVELPPSYRNAMPSLHTTWALLVFLGSQACGRAEKALAGTALVFTLIATLGSGEHYLVDLVVAVPFTVATCAAGFAGFGGSRRDRLTAVLVGGAATLLWIGYLRFGQALWRDAAALNLALAAATLLSLRLLRPLLGVSQAPPPRVDPT